MARPVYVRVRVPSKKSLEFFETNWKRKNCPVIDGEYTIPDRSKILEINPANTSHAITEVRHDSFDDKTSTVVIGVVFTGPMAAYAQDEYLKEDIRFMPRVARMRPPGGTEKDCVDAIVTWDLVHRPKDIGGVLASKIGEEKIKMRAEANAKDRRIELAKKKMKK